MNTNGCPTRIQLEAFARGDVSGSLFDDLSGHLERCVGCQSTFDALDDVEDPLDILVDDYPDVSAYASEPELAAVLRRIEQEEAALCAEVTKGPDASDGQAIGKLGDFRIIREIGRGGMGVVYEAEQVSLKRRVALKTLPLAAVLDPRKMRRFQIEAQAVASLDHEHIVPVYGIGEEQGLHYYAMRYIDGRTLARVIEDQRQSTIDEPSLEQGDFEPGNGSIVDSRLNPHPTPSIDPGRTTTLASPQPPVGEVAFSTKLNRSATGVPFLTWTSNARRRSQETQARGNANLTGTYFRSIAELGVQAADALQHAHEEGVVHRDIKPSNLILDAKGKLWVADFGLARVESEASLSASGDVLGTLMYMSPEQALGRRVIDGRADVYSLGATLYELLTLESLFADADRRQLLNRIVADQPKLLRSINSAVPKELETIVLKALSKESADRYPTAGALAADLRRFVEGRPIIARRPSFPERCIKWMRRNRAVAALSMTSIILVFFLALFLALYSISLSAFNSELAQLNTDLEDSLTVAVEKEQQAQNLLYTSDIRLANQALKRGDLRQVSELLQRHRPLSGQPDHRGFEWHFLQSRSQAGHVSLPSHDGGAYFVCYSPDGRWIATAGEDARVQISNAASSREQFTLDTEQGEVNGIAFAPDGQTLASTGDDGTIRIWDLEVRHQLRSIQAFDGEAYNVLFTPDGTQLISAGNDPVIRIWNPASGESTGSFEGHTDTAGAIALSPDGRILGSASDDGTVRLWDLKTRTELRVMQSGLNRLVTIDFSPDGKLVAAGGIDRVSHVWETAIGSRIFHAIHPDIVQSLAFAGDGKWIATGDRGGTIRLWRLNPGGGTVTHTPADNPLAWTGHSGRVYSICFSPDGSRLVSTGQDGTVKSWTPFARSVRRELQTPILTKYIEFTPDSRFLVTADEFRGPCLWDPATGDAVKWLGQGRRPRTDVAVSPNGRYMATGDWDGVVQLWDWMDGQQVASWDHPQRHLVGALNFSPSGAALAVNYGDGSVRFFDGSTGSPLTHAPVWTSAHPDFSPKKSWLAVADENDVQLCDLTTGETLRTLSGHTSSVTQVVFSPDGRWLATAGEDRRVLLWDPTTAIQQHSLTGHQSPVGCLAFSPDGRSLLSADRSGTLKVWQVATGQSVYDFDPQPRGYFKIVFSPDGRRLAMALRDGRVEILDLVAQPPPTRSTGSLGSKSTTGRLTRTSTLMPKEEFLQKTLRGHSAGIGCVRISPDGAVIASSDNDGVIKLWNLATGQELQTLRGHTAAVQFMSFHPDGTLLASGSHDHSVRLWDFETGEQVRMLPKFDEQLTRVFFHPDGRHLFTSEHRSKIGIWDAMTGELQHTIDADDVPGGSGQPVYDLVLSPDGSTLASSDPQGRIALWNVANREYIVTMPEVGTPRAFSPDGKKLLAIARHGELALYEVATGETIRDFVGHTAHVHGAAFSPDGLSVASTCVDGTIRVWDVATGRLVLNWQGHEDEAFSPRFTSDGHVLVTCSRDHTVQIWNLLGEE